MDACVFAIHGVAMVCEYVCGNVPLKGTERQQNPVAFEVLKEMQGDT